MPSSRDRSENHHFEGTRDSAFLLYHKAKSPFHIASVRKTAEMHQICVLGALLVAVRHIL